MRPLPYLYYILVVPVTVHVHVCGGIAVYFACLHSVVISFTCLHNVVIIILVSCAIWGVGGGGSGEEVTR